MKEPTNPFNDNSNTISFIFEDGKGIEITIELVVSIKEILSFSILPFNSSHISFKSSN